MSYDESGNLAQKMTSVLRGKGGPSTISMMG